MDLIAIALATTASATDVSSLNRKYIFSKIMYLVEGA